MSTLVATTIDDDDDDDEVREIPLPNVKDAVLAKVIQYCTHYKTVEAMTPIQTPLKSSKIEDLVQPWYADFVKVEHALLFELVTAANFMDIKPLLDLTCLGVSVFIKVSEIPVLYHGVQGIEIHGQNAVHWAHYDCLLFRNCRANLPVNCAKSSILATTLRQKKRLRFGRKTNGWSVPRNPTRKQKMHGRGNTVYQYYSQWVILQKG